MRPMLACLLSISCLLLQGPCAWSEEPAAVTKGVSIELNERGAVLIEDFEGTEIDRAKWRIWQENPDQTSVKQAGGRLHLSARGLIGHNGLWGLTTTRTRDVVLIGEMGITSQGDSPHRLALHFCGGDGEISPDHWIEIDMVDLGEKTRFSAMAALPVGIPRPEGQSIDLPHAMGQGFLGRIELNGQTNLVEVSVHSAQGWQRVCNPIEVPLRTVHTEIKLHGSQPSVTGATTESQAWFDNVRIYPKPDSHYVGVRLVRKDGSPIWIRENGGWPPKILDSSGKLRSIEDIEVRLCTENGDRIVSAVRSSNMGFYLLPLKEAPWDVYPVAAQVTLILNGKPMGEPLGILHRQLQGLYPDDVYDVVME